MNSGRKLWIVLARPDRLHLARSAVEAIGQEFPGGCHLLREHSAWWDRAGWEALAGRFASVRAFPRVETCRGLRDLRRLYRETRARRLSMAALPIDSEHDVLLCLAGTLSIANAAASAHPAVFKVLVIAQLMFDDLLRPIDRKRFRFTTSGWFQNRLVEPLAGVARTVNLRPRFRSEGDGARFSRFSREVSDIFEATIVLNNEGREGGLVPSQQKVFAARFPRISELARGASVEQPRRDEPRRVLFFGTPFLLIRNLEPDVYAARLNECLEYLRSHYAPACRLIYRPHPAEKSESTKLDLRGFEVEEDREAAELYFLKHFDSVAAVYSVSSTVSRVALNNGLNAYAFWRTFPFAGAAADFFAKVMGEVPREFDIRNLAEAPVAYADRISQEPTANSFRAVLMRVVERAPAGRGIAKSEI